MVTISPTFFFFFFHGFFQKEAQGEFNCGEVETNLTSN